MTKAPNVFIYCDSCKISVEQAQKCIKALEEQRDAAIATSETLIKRVKELESTIQHLGMLNHGTEEAHLRQKNEALQKENAKLMGHLEFQRRLSAYHRDRFDALFDSL